MYFIGIIIFIGFFAILGLNILIYKSVYKSALQNYIIPDLINRNYSFIRDKSLGFFDTGDFRTDIPPLLNKHPHRNIYIDIYYKENNLEKRVTVRVQSFFFDIKRITYSRDI